MLLLVGSASAHSPHDVAPFVSVDGDGTIFTADTELLAWSRDRGATWAYRYLDGGTPVCGVVDGGFTVGTEEGGVWTSVDGLTWSPVAGPTHATACARGVVGGAEGLWVDGVQVLEDPVLAVAGRDAALLADGTVAVAPTWSRTAAVAQPTVVAMAGADPVVGTSLTELLRWDGAAWQPVAGSPLGVEALLVDGATWLAATAREGVWVSRDDGATWALENTGFETISDGPGSPPDGVHFLGFDVREGVWYSAQWEGVWWKTPDEARWHEGAIDIVPRTRGVDWLPDGEVLGAVYGGGVYRGSPGTQAWGMVSRGVRWPYPKQVLQRGDDMYLVSGSILYRSTDAGVTWDDIPLDADDVGDHVAVDPAYPDRPIVFAAARAGGHGGAYVSTDRGETWTWAPVPGICTEKPVSVESDGTTAWLACGYRGELYRSGDEGASWELVDTLGFNIWDILPEDPPLLATERGLLVWDGEAATVALEGHDVDQVVRGPDGRLWATTPAEGVYAVGSDGSATAVGWPVLDRVEELAIGADGAFAAGTRTGIYTSADGLEWARANAVDWLDDAIQFWWFEGDWSLASGSDYAGAEAHDGGEGAVAELSFWGEQVRVYGASANGARARVTVDGAETDLEFDRDTPYGTIFAADLPAGTHTLALSVDGGHLTVDLAEVWRADAPALDGPEETRVPTDPGGCGCGGDAKAASVLLLLPLVRRRRSR